MPAQSTTIHFVFNTHSKAAGSGFSPSSCICVSLRAFLFYTIPHPPHSGYNGLQWVEKRLDFRPIAVSYLNCQTWNIAITIVCFLVFVPAQHVSCSTIQQLCDCIKKKGMMTPANTQRTKAGEKLFSPWIDHSGNQCKQHTRQRACLICIRKNTESNYCTVPRRWTLHAGSNAFLPIMQPSTA